MNIATLLKWISLAGTKLPLIWPDLLTIAAAVQRIATTIGGINPPVFMATADTSKVLEAITNEGIDADEAQGVVQIFSAAGRAGL